MKAFAKSRAVSISRSVAKLIPTVLMDNMVRDHQEEIAGWEKKLSNVCEGKRWVKKKLDAALSKLDRCK